MKTFLYLAFCLFPFGVFAQDAPISLEEMSPEEPPKLELILTEGEIQLEVKYAGQKVKLINGQTSSKKLVRILIEPNQINFKYFYSPCFTSYCGTSSLRRIPYAIYSQLGIALEMGQNKSRKLSLVKNIQLIPTKSIIAPALFYMN